MNFFLLQKLKAKTYEKIFLKFVVKQGRLDYDGTSFQTRKFSETDTSVEFKFLDLKQSKFKEKRNNFFFSLDVLQSC